MFTDSAAQPSVQATPRGRRSQRREPDTDWVDGFHREPRSNMRSSHASDALSNSDAASSEPDGSESSDEQGSSDDSLDVGPSNREQATCWNSPEGWLHVEQQIERFHKDLSKPTHVCAICGNRKDATREVHADIMLESWRIATDIDDLRNMLYTQYPKMEHLPNVRSSLSIVVTWQQRYFFVCSRCYTEGQSRLQYSVEEYSTDYMCLHFPMKFSKRNTHLEFRTVDFRDALQRINLVEESMISLVSALVVMEKLQGR